MPAPSTPAPSQDKVMAEMLSPEKGTKRKDPADTEYTEIEVVPKKIFFLEIPESECSVCHERCYWRLSKTTCFGRCKDWECRGRAMILGRRVGDVEEGQIVAGEDVAESEKELIDKAIQKFMLDNGFSDGKIYHNLRAEYDCFVECAGCRGNGQLSVP